MIREFVYTLKFDKEWSRLGLNDDDLIPLEEFLLKNPKAGDIIEGTGGIRKVRWALPGKGKSGGTRVLYIDYIHAGKICLFDLFPKGDKDNLSQAEKNELRKVVKAIGEGFRK